MTNLLIETLENQQRDLRQKLSGTYVKRDKLAEAQKIINNSLIKVVLGPRRAGKSIFSLMLYKDRPFAYLNFDDDNLPPLKNINTNELLKQVFSVYGETKNILFDEIQNLDRWELFANRLQREGYNIILTGSNAKLLSKELATHLTGRHLPIELMPFNFKEFLRAKNFSPADAPLSSPEHKGRLLFLLKEYVAGGGYPEVVVGEYQPREYLATLYDALLFKDVAKRHHVRYLSVVEEIGSFLINQPASEFSYRKISRALNFKNILTIQKYVDYLEEAYIFFMLGRFSPKTKERLTLPKKIFAIDNGFIAAKAVLTSPNNGHLIENTVGAELIKRGLQPNRELFYYKTKNQKEIDFLIRQNLRVTTLMQVAYDISNSDVLARETNALVEAGAELECDNLIIINWEREETLAVKGKKIQLIPLWRWLLGG